jgi:hypothetical protein
MSLGGSYARRLTPELSDLVQQASQEGDEARLLIFTSFQKSEWRAAWPRPSND